MNSSGKIVKCVVLLVSMVTLAIAAVVLFGGKSPKPRAMPNPNGYDDFIRAGQMMAAPLGRYNKVSREELAALVATNEEALKELCAGLGRNCRMPEGQAPNYAGDLMSQLNIMKRLSAVPAAAGRLAELEGRTNDAVKCSLDGIRFGQEFSRGGIIGARSTGMNCERMHLKCLESLAGGLGAQACRDVVQGLEIIEAKEEPSDETLADQEIWTAKTTPSLWDKIQHLRSYKSVREYKQKFVQEFESAELERRRVMLAFAARAYELERGKRAQSAADLVPGYLKSVPQDPTTGTNLVLGL